MAGLKKKKKENTGSPNIVLVIFMIFFILSTITLGSLFYFSLEEKETYRVQRVKADASLAAEKSAVTYYRLLYRELRSAVGDTLEPAEITELKIDRDARAKGTFDKVSANKEREMKVLKDLEGSLGGMGDDGFAKNYPGLLKESRDELDKEKGTAVKEVASHVQTKALQAKIAKNTNDIYDAAKKRIDEGNLAALNELQKRSDEFRDLVKKKQELKDELDVKQAELLKLREDFDITMKLKDRQLVVLKALAKENDAVKGGGAVAVARSDSFPLLLDISPGKPLWDHPVGRVTRVDLDLRQVVINIGSHRGAKPELTFNIFAANSAGRAEKQMKGSIEIVKVLGPDSSVARITSLFDGEGIEIPLGVQSRGRILRETDAPLREGDLLFNMFWGTRVAIAGTIPLDDTASSNPADQHRNVMNMVNLLERQGMAVDAYVDLTDGSIKGKITNKTRYLIVGEAPRGPGRLGKIAQAPKELPKEDPEEKKDGDDPAKMKGDDAGDNGGRVALIGDSMKKLRDDAASKGLLQISSENFLNVIGYRRARSANTEVRSTFRPFLPNAGIGVVPVVRDPAPPMEPKMPPPEKKDDN